MKDYLILVFLILNFKSFSQNEFDYPIVDLKKSDGKIIWFNSIHDSVKVDVNTIGVDFEDYNKPAVYIVTLYKNEEVKFHRIIVLSIKDSSYRMSTSRMPDICSSWEQLDSSKHEQHKSKGQFIGFRGFVADSTSVLDEKCMECFFKSDNDTTNTDTIYFNGYFENSIYEFRNLRVWSCDYYYEIKHGKEQTNYSISELNNQIILGDKIGVKYLGNWKYGLKHGKWLFYDKSGIITKEEKYKKGKLKKSKIY